MTDVTLATLDDLRTVVADLLDADQPLVLGRQRARKLLDLSDSTFGRLVNEGVIRPVPHLRPAKYSIELLRRFAAGDEHAFAPAGASTSAGTRPLAEVNGPAGADGTDLELPGSVSLLPNARGAEEKAGPTTTGDAA